MPSNTAEANQKGNYMNYYEFTLANEIAAIEAIRACRDYTVIGFTDFGLVCWLPTGCSIK